jgi:DNA-binding transcriptional ArsR family regulator
MFNEKSAGMKYTDTNGYEEKARIIKAMAHPSRLKIIDYLADGPKCVCELRDIVGSDQSTVSRHLAVLKNAGILTSEKRGLQVYYKLQRPCVLKFMECIEEVMEKQYAYICEILR